MSTTNHAEAHCRHCGDAMYWNETLNRWQTVYVNSVDPDQCFMRNGQLVEPVNDGHETTGERRA